MALSVKQINRFKFGNGYGVVAELTGDSSYSTGGYGLIAKQLGLSVLDNVLTQSPASGKFWEYDFANKKIKILSAVGTEVDNKSDQSAAKTRVTVFGW